jgi:glycerate 2-kinase
MIIKNYNEIISNGSDRETMEKRRDALDIIDAAVKAVDPYESVKRVITDDYILVDEKRIDVSCFDHIYVVGFGKASVNMAKAVLDSIRVDKGVLISNDPGSMLKLQGTPLEVHIGGHPIPNQGSLAGTDRILSLLEKTTVNDLVIVLISGGGSSLFCKPRVSLRSLQWLTETLWRLGADIKEINTIRKHLSYVKGGQLAKMNKGTMISLVISDIVGDPLEFIASAPTYPDTTTFNDAKNICQRYSIWDNLPVDVRSVIEQGINGVIPENPGGDDPAFKRVYHTIIASNTHACLAAKKKSEYLGYKTMMITTLITGEAREAGLKLMLTAKDLSKGMKRTAIIGGGETTVTVKGHGLGGRNHEVVLSCVDELSKTDWVLVSFATDGADGNSESAGAIADHYTLQRALELDLNPAEFLENNDSYTFFDNLGDAIITGLTGTNVMDVHVVLT